MKTTLLLLFSFFFSVTAIAQSPINEYYGYIYNGDVTDGISTRAYSVVNSTNALNHTAGPNQTWNFTDLSMAGVSFYDQNAPGSGDANNYPGTTRVVNNITTIGTTMTTSKALLNGGGTFTGATTSYGVTLNFITNNATIGTFPLTYGYTNTDPCSGVFNYTTFNGTFTGTIVSSVDAYGTLNLNDFGNGSSSVAVTRLKTVITANLNYPPIGAVGTVTVTSYFYYRLNDLFPFFTSINAAAVIPLLTLNQNTTVNEAAFPILLGTPDFNSQSISIAPNPVRDLLTIQGIDDLSIRSVNIIDTSGKVVVKTKTSDGQVDISMLANGIYFIKIDADNGSVVKKIIKN